MATIVNPYAASAHLESRLVEDAAMKDTTCFAHRFFKHHCWRQQLRLPSKREVTGMGGE